MKFTRRQVISALRTEPLRCDHWISKHDDSTQSFYDDSSPAKQLKCKVCAVGAVLRKNTNLTPSEIVNIGDCIFYSTNLNISNTARETDILKLLNQKNYLAALSGYFESTIPKRGAYGKRHRERLVEWVKENFPVEFELEYI